jgi:hypothetical protein
VDEQGNVFVADIGTGLWKIAPDGKLTHAHKEAGHWLALDAAGTFARVDFEKSERWPRWFKRRTPAGARPALITDGGSPLVVHPDGHLYYVSNGEKITPGGLEITRLSTDGTLKRLTPTLSETSEKLGGIKGLTTGPDGSLYITYPKAVLKVTTAGTVTTLANPVVVRDCDTDFPPDSPADQKPFLRGLAVDAQGVVYAAATGCRCVVKIPPDGEPVVVLKAVRPWGPTGVAVRGGVVYVLEYPNPNGPHTPDWLPRVRKLRADGTVTTSMTITAEDRDRLSR